MNADTRTDHDSSDTEPKYVVVNTNTDVPETEPVPYERAKELLSIVRKRLDYSEAYPFSLKLRKVDSDTCRSGGDTDANL